MPRIRDVVVKSHNFLMEHHPILDIQPILEVQLISHKHFVIEVKGIHAGLVMVEANTEHSPLERHLLESCLVPSLSLISDVIRDDNVPKVRLTVS